MARALSPDVDEAIFAATRTLLAEQGFARMSMEAVARSAGVGKPAIYRRFPDKAALVVAVIASQLEPLEPADLGDTRAELWQAMRVGFPADGPVYVGLIGGLIAEHERHPELIAAFRESVLGPRRTVVRGLIERGQRRGDIRTDVKAEAALDLLAGPLLARVFAGVEPGRAGAQTAFETWWNLVKGAAVIEFTIETDIARRRTSCSPTRPTRTSWRRGRRTRSPR